MNKYDKLINGLHTAGKLYKANYNALVKANSKAFNPLVEALIGHENPDIRETCAEILHEINTPKAIPYLIEALKDKSLYVRQDAL